MERYGDKLRAFAFTIGLHAACFALLLAGMWWVRESRPVVMPGPVIEATLVGPTSAPKPRASEVAQEKPRPQPKPEPDKPEPRQETPTPPPTEVIRQDQVERERIAALAREQAEQAEREQEARRRQEQVELEEEQRRIENERRKRQLAEIRAQREAAERKLALEQMKLAQLKDRQDADGAAPAEVESAQAQTGAGGADDDLTARYAAAIQAAVTQNWHRPESAVPGLRCVLRIAQIPGGEVISVSVGTPCNADQATRNSIEQAVLRAAPLPYQGYEPVFQRNINFHFRYDG